jgi:mRNA interferase MazF
MIRRHLQRGELVLAVIPFTDLGATKLRPALVISDGAIGEDVVLVAISSVIRGSTATHDVIIDGQHAEFPKTGLLRTSVVRTHHLVTVDQRMLTRRLGSLPEIWQRQVDERLAVLLGLTHSD